MKVLIRSFLVFIMLVIADKGFASNTGDFSKPVPKNSDSTSVTPKSNIVIFKMLPTPAYSNTGSLKKAGKVARTSNSRS
ncbi:MAG: hypothetical protein H0X46_04035 [Bacteroidetes bacterium]|nr:hypothetical protein [Bacteroidota bacterium]